MTIYKAGTKELIGVTITTTGAAATISTTTINLRLHFREWRISDKILVYPCFLLIANLKKKKKKKSRITTYPEF